MRAHQVGHPAACKAILARGGDYALTAKPMRRWGARTLTSLQRDFREADRRYRCDSEFRDDCDFWLPVFEDAEIWKRSPWQSFLRIKGIKS